MPCSGTEQGDEFDVGGTEQEVDRRDAGPGPPGVVGHQADSLVPQLAETPTGQDIDAAINRADRRSLGNQRFRGDRLAIDRLCGRVDDRRGHQRGDLGPQADGAAPLAIGMEPAGQEDHERLGLGVDPDAGAGEPGVAEAGRPEQRPSRTTVSRLDVPPQAAPLAFGRRAGVDHRPDGQGRKHPLAVKPFAAIEEHLGEHGEVVGRAKKPGVTGHAAEGSRSRVMDHPPEHPRSFSLGGGDPRDRRRLIGQAADGPEPGVNHPQWVEDRPPGELVERLPRNLLDQPAEHHESDVAIHEPFAGRLLGLEVADSPPGDLPALRRSR